MRHLIGYGICCSLLGLTLSGVASGAASQTEPKGVEFRYQLTRDVITLREPVVLLLTVYNGLAQPLNLMLGADSTEFFRFSVTTPAGQVLEVSPDHKEGFYPRIKIVVPPGEEYKQKLLLSQWFQFNSVGTYRLTAQLALEIDQTEVALIRPQLYSTQLQITPRDANRLEKICAELADEVKKAPSAQAAREPALELSSVQDPISVPFLAEVLSAHKLAEGIAVDALEKIDNDQAVKVLLAALHDQFDDIANMSRQALRRMLERTSEPGIRVLIQNALKDSG